MPGHDEQPLGRKSSHDRTLSDVYSRRLPGHRTNVIGIVSEQDARAAARPYRGKMKLNLGLNEDAAEDES